MELLREKRPNNPSPDKKQYEDYAKMLYDDTESLKKEALQTSIY